MPRPPTKPITLASRLDRHPFAVGVFEDNRAVLKSAYAPGASREVEAAPERPLSELEWYVRACGFSLAHALGLIHQLAQVPGYLAQYRRTSALASREVTRVSDVTYHLENFLIRTQSFQDRTLQLCASVLHTGLDLRSVRYTDMIRNNHVRSTGIQDLLKAINTLCQQYAMTRNQVIHQHGLLDADLRRVELILMGSRAVEKDRRGAMASAYRFLVGEVASRKTAELDEFTRSAIGLAEELFAALAPRYERMKDRLLDP